jgi:hypothetical protein
MYNLKSSNLIFDDEPSIITGANDAIIVDDDGLEELLHLDDIRLLSQSQSQSQSNNPTDGDWGLDFKRKINDGPRTATTFDEIIASRRLQQQQQHQHQHQHQQLQRNQQAGSRRVVEIEISKEAKHALEKAIWSAIRSPSGDIVPDLMQVALNTGLPTHAILNAARVALQRETAKLQELRIQALEEQIQQEREQRRLEQINLGDGSCVICMDEPRTNAFITCGHVCTCQSCSNELFMMGTGTNDGRRRNRRAQCPICKQYSKRIIQLYHP